MRVILALAMKKKAIPEPLTSLYDPSLINESEEIIKNKSLSLWENYTKTLYKCQLQNLYDITLSQNLNKIWKL